jgi:hypothetical protein
MDKLTRRISIVLMSLALAACAGYQGRPEDISAKLKAKYVGKSVDEVISNMGVPANRVKLDSGRWAYTWLRQTNQFATNVLIKSEERCSVTMLTDVGGNNIEIIGKVEDSLGAWQLSYCAEHLNLKP